MDEGSHPSLVYSGGKDFGDPLGMSGIFRNTMAAEDPRQICLHAGDMTGTRNLGSGLRFSKAAILLYSSKYKLKTLSDAIGP